MNEPVEISPNLVKSTSSHLDAVALYGYNSISLNLSRLFSSVGLHVYLILSNPTEICSSSINNLTIVNNESDLPYLSSVLINCQNDLLLIKNLLTKFPDEYKSHMAYIECSQYLKQNQIDLFYKSIQFKYYLCMNLIEYETSTMIKPDCHLICSGDQIVFQKLLLQTNIPAKMTFLNQTKTPFDSFYICLLYRYSQAIHLAIYAEIIAILKAANHIYPGNLQFLIDWSYIKRPLMRQMILQSLSSSSFQFTTINDFQLLIECIIDYFYEQNSNQNLNNNHLKNLTLKFYNFLSSLDINLKQKPIYELFTLY